MHKAYHNNKNLTKNQAKYEKNKKLKIANNQIAQPKFQQTEIRVVSKADYEQN